MMEVNVQVPVVVTTEVMQTATREVIVSQSIDQMRQVVEIRTHLLNESGEKLAEGYYEITGDNYLSFKQSSNDFANYTETDLERYVMQVKEERENSVG